MKKLVTGILFFCSTSIITMEQVSETESIQNNETQLHRLVKMPLTVLQLVTNFQEVLERREVSLDAKNAQGKTAENILNMRRNALIDELKKAPETSIEGRNLDAWESWCNEDQDYLVDAISKEIATVNLLLSMIEEERERRVSKQDKV